MNSNRSFAFIPARFTQLAFAFYMSAIMAFLMTIILVLINTGYDSAFWMRAFQSYIIAWPIAFFLRHFYASFGDAPTFLDCQILTGLL